MSENMKRAIELMNGDTRAKADAVMGLNARARQNVPDRGRGGVRQADLAAMDKEQQATQDFRRKVAMEMFNQSTEAPWRAPDAGEHARDYMAAGGDVNDLRAIANERGLQIFVPPSPEAGRTVVAPSQMIQAQPGSQNVPQPGGRNQNAPVAEVETAPIKGKSDALTAQQLAEHQKMLDRVRAGRNADRR